jgi:hypothetical protein
MATARSHEGHGGSQLALLSEQESEVVEALGGKRMVLAQRLLPN